MSPPISIFLTTIASQPALRQRQEYLLRILQAKKIPFTSYDLASDEDAKRLWRRKTPQDKQQIPGILVGYQFVGTFSQFEDAVEMNTLDSFLKLKEPWDPAIDEDPRRPPPASRPIGVPGAQTPMEMTPDHIKKLIVAEQSSPLRVKNKVKPIPVNKVDDKKRINIGDDLEGHGLEGLKVTEDELKDLMSQLGLGGQEADDLAKGLSFASPKNTPGKGKGKSTNENSDVNPLAPVEKSSPGPKAEADPRLEGSKAKENEKEPGIDKVASNEENRGPKEGGDLGPKVDGEPGPKEESKSTKVETAP